MKILEDLIISRLRQALVEELMVTKKEYGPEYLQLTEALLQSVEASIAINCEVHKLDGHKAVRAFCETIARMEDRYHQLSEELSAVARARN